MHKQCPNCQQLLDESARFCPICGTSVGEVKPLDSPLEISQEQMPPPLLAETPPPPSAEPASFALPPPPVSIPPGEIKLGKPALLAGVLMGVASALPVVGCCCWLWVIAGGILAVYFLRQENPSEFNAGLGAKLGFLTGMIGAAVWEIMSLPMLFIARPPNMEQLQEIVPNLETLPPEMSRFVEMIMQFVNQPFHPWILFFGLFAKLLVCAIFTTVGGILGVAFFGKPKLK